MVSLPKLIRKADRRAAVQKKPRGIPRGENRTMVSLILHRFLREPGAAIRVYGCNKIGSLF